MCLIRLGLLSINVSSFRFCVHFDNFRFASVKRVSPHADLLSYVRASLDKLEGNLLCHLVL